MKLSIKLLFLIIVLLEYKMGFGKLVCDTSLYEKEMIVNCTTYYNNGKLKKIYSKKNNNFHGIYTRFYKNGNIESMCNYANGEIIDTSISYYPSGKIHSIGLINGMWYELSENGDTLLKGYSLDGKSIGIRKGWYSNNKLKFITKYDSSSNKHGWEVFWYDNGNVKDSTFYRNDSVLYGKTFYYNGEISVHNIEIWPSYNVISYDPEGNKTGEIKDGNGSIFTCDSLGKNCKELKYKDGKHVFK